MQLVTPILIKEWGITPAVMGFVTSASRWIGLIGTFVFPVFADLYGRRPALIWAILGYSVFTGLTGFSTGWVTLLIFSSLTRIALAGENPVGMLMVTETAPTRWRGTALGGLVGGYPFGYMLCSLAALVVVPLWGWRSLYFLGILPALLVLWIRIGIKESPRYEHVTTQMLKEGLKKQLDIFAPGREYPFVAIFAYWFCGWLCDQFGRRWVIPAFAVPGSIALIAMGYLDDATSLFWVGLATNFLITGSFGTGLAIPPRCSRRRSAAPRWVPHSPSAWASPRSHR
jgi:MFS family permease